MHGVGWRRLAAGSMVLAGLAAPPASARRPPTIVVTTLVGPRVDRRRPVLAPRGDHRRQHDDATNNDVAAGGASLDTVIGSQVAGTIPLSSNLPHLTDGPDHRGATGITIDGQVELHADQHPRRGPGS